MCLSSLQNHSPISPFAQCLKIDALYILFHFVVVQWEGKSCTNYSVIAKGRHIVSFFTSDSFKIFCLMFLMLLSTGALSLGLDHRLDKPTPPCLLVHFFLFLFSFSLSLNFKNGLGSRE